MNQPSRNYYVFVLGIAAVLTLSIIVIAVVLFGTPSQEKRATPVPTPHAPISPVPTLFPTPTPSQLYLSPVLKNELVEAMPIVQSGYTIEYLRTSDTFVVTVLEDPYETNKQLADNWFIDQGVEDLRSLNIMYHRLRDVQ